MSDSSIADKSLRWYINEVAGEGWGVWTLQRNISSQYYERKCSEYDNPTLGIILCADIDSDIARYSMLHGSEQLFASKCKLLLPFEEELRAEIEAQKMFWIEQHGNEEAAKERKT